MNKNKKGISLIVLVITIIVMIIISTAIILSLNSNNMTGKANEAKLSSDLANKKEAASVYLSEYQINVAKGKIDREKVTADEYVKSELKKAGLDTTDIAITEKGDILAGIAAMFVNNNVKIGTEIKGYTLVKGAETHETTGSENTSEEAIPQPDEITRDENIIWQYMGIDESGNALIVGSVTEQSPIMSLGGKGGYLNGPQALDAACKEMYSSSMGTARSINIDDVTRVLGYTGERGSYYNKSEVYIPVLKAKTINEIAREIGYDINNLQTQTPEDGKNISNAYVIYKNDEEDKKQYNSSDVKAVNLIFPEERVMDPLSYWLSSSCVLAEFDSNRVGFRVRYVLDNGVFTEAVFFSNGISSSPGKIIRPVVSLNPLVKIVSYDGTTVTIK